MAQALNRFILGFPVLFLKQYPYAWIAVVTLWPHSPSLAVAFLAVVLTGILSLRWQSAAWISHMRFQHAGPDGKFHVDQPPIDRRRAAFRIALLVAGGALLAFLLQGRLGLTFWQYFVMIVGFTLFYQDTRFFGSAVTYLITAAGIAIRFVPGHLDYRLFLPFREISRIERREYRKDPAVDLFARTSDVQEGLLLVPRDPNGFTRRIDKLFIAPGRVEAFMQQLPYGIGQPSVFSTSL
jgi:hypothetical protein